MVTLAQRITAFSYRRQRLDGSAQSALEAVRAVVGVYSAMPSGPLSIRARAPGTGPDDVRALELHRVAVRMRAMRTSAFLVPRETAARVAAATAVPEGRFAWLLRGSGVPEDGLAAVRSAVLAVAGEPGTPAELRDRLTLAGIGGQAAPWTTGAAFGRVLSLLTAFGDLLAVGGSSLSSNALRYVSRHAWLGEAEDIGDVGGGLAPGEARRWLAGEYLRAFGPARIEDLAWWAAMPRATALEALADVDTVDVGGGLLLLAADLPSFEATVPLDDGIALVPKWDAWTMGYPLDGRSRFLDRDVHDRVFDGDGNGLAMVLRAGRAIGAWAHRGERGVGSVDLDLFERVPAATREAIDAELEAIAAFLGYRRATVRDVPTVVPNRRRQRRPLDD